MSITKRVLISIAAVSAGAIAFGRTIGRAMFGLKSEAAALALRHPPSCIAGFKVTPVRRLAELDIAVRFSLSCLDCASQKLRLLCYPITAADSEAYADVKAGEVVERNPHHVVCVDCGSRKLLFDATKHGYDGALGHGSTYEQGEGEEKPINCRLDSYVVEVLFIYNIELSELQEITAEKQLKPQDLFDFISISAVSSDGVELASVGYECA